MSGVRMTAAERNALLFKKLNRHLGTSDCVECKDAIFMRHSWLGLVSHFVFDEKKASRCHIGELRLYDGELAFIVHFKYKGESVHYPASITSMLDSHIQWMKNILVSSDEEDATQIPAAARTLFPVLKVTNINALPQLQQEKINWLLEEVNTKLAYVENNVAF